MTASSTIKGYSEFISGLQMIEREIVSLVREAGGQIDARNFCWHQGRELLPPPSAIELKITTPGRAPINVAFSREEVEDSWDRLDRGDIRSKVRDVVEELTKP